MTNLILPSLYLPRGVVCAQTPVSSPASSLPLLHLRTDKDVYERNIYYQATILGSGLRHNDLFPLCTATLSSVSHEATGQ